MRIGILGSGTASTSAPAHLLDAQSAAARGAGAGADGSSSTGTHV